MDPIGASREDRHPDDAQEQVETRSRQPAPGTQQRPGEEHAERLQGQRHVLVDGHVEAAQLHGWHRHGRVGAEDEQRSACQDERDVTHPGGSSLCDRRGQQGLGQRHLAGSEGGRVSDGGHRPGMVPADTRARQSSRYTRGP